MLGHDWKIPILGNLHIFEGSHESLWFSTMLKLKANIIELMDMLVMHYCRAHIWIVAWFQMAKELAGSFISWITSVASTLTEVWTCYPTNWICILNLTILSTVNRLCTCRKSVNRTLIIKLNGEKLFKKFSDKNNSKFNISLNIGLEITKSLPWNPTHQGLPGPWFP